MASVLPPPLPENKKNQSCSELSETNFGIGFASIRENFFSILENSAVILKDFENFRVRTSSLHRPVFSQMEPVKYSSALWSGLNEDDIVCTCMICVHKCTYVYKSVHTTNYEHSNLNRLLYTCAVECKSRSKFRYRFCLDLTDFVSIWQKNNIHTKIWGSKPKL